MGKTADLKVLQKPLLKKLAVHRELYPSIFVES